MRTIKDCKGIEASVKELSVVHTIPMEAGLGPSRLARLFIEHQLPRYLGRWKDVPFLIIGEPLDASGDQFPECVVALVTSVWVPEPDRRGEGFTRLAIVTFQNEQDPFEKLKSVFGTIDWAAHAEYVEY